MAAKSRYMEELFSYLFPIVGNCRNNKTIINGRAYEIPNTVPVKQQSFI